MALFPTNDLTAEDVERELKRPLNGDPSEGEFALVCDFKALRLDEVRRKLERDRAIGKDCRELIERKLQELLRQGEQKSWSVKLPMPLFQEYAQLARASATTIGACLRAAIERDSARRKQDLDVASSLEQAVREYNRATSVLLGEVRDLVTRVGSIQDLAMRMTRLEGALSSGVGDRRR